MSHQADLNLVFEVLKAKAQNDPLLRAQLEAATWEAIAMEYHSAIMTDESDGDG